MTSTLNLLGRATREFTAAKRHRKRQCFWELAAAVVALLSLPFKSAAVAVAILIAAAAAKAIAKWSQMKSRSAFRVAERARRLHFRERTLGWRVQPEQYGELLLSFSPSSRALAAEAAAKLEDDYFLDRGTPGVPLMLSNLRESIFWSERLSRVMAKRRAWQCFAAILLMILPLVAAVLGTSQAASIVIVRGVAAVFVLVVSLDYFGEHRSFQRNEAELHQLASTCAHMARNHASLEAALPLLSEYDCMMVDRPMVPDEVHAAHREELEDAWRAQREAERAAAAAS
jgi:hypothetical protein